MLHFIKLALYEQPCYVLRSIRKSRCYKNSVSYKALNPLVGKILMLPVQFYRFFISPLLIPTCRFIPTCSDYTVDALKQYGVLKGILLVIKRILKCNPFHKGGYDPLPVNKAK